MRFTYKGKQYRIPAETNDKKTAEKILRKLLTEIAEGKWFERLAHSDKTLADLLDKYIKEHAIPNKAANTVKADQAIVREMKGYFGTENRPIGSVQAFGQRHWQSQWHTA